MQVIARVDRLQVLNATPVTLHERKDSELQYVRSILGKHPVRAHSHLCSVPAAHHNIAHLTALSSKACTFAASVEYPSYWHWHLSCSVVFSGSLCHAWWSIQGAYLLLAGQLGSLSGSEAEALKRKHPRLQQLHGRSVTLCASVMQCLGSSSVPAIEVLNRVYDPNRDTSMLLASLHSSVWNPAQVQRCRSKRQAPCGGTGPGDGVMRAAGCALWREQSHDSISTVCRYGDAGAASSAPSGGTALSCSMLQLTLTHMQDGAQPSSRVKRLPRMRQA